MMRYTTLFLAAALAFSSCKKLDLDIQNLNGGKIVVMGHGGMGIHSTYPLDSPAGVLSCLSSDADGSEIDVQLTSDSVLVAYHSADLSEGTNMSGPVWRHTWAQIQQGHFTGVPYTDHHLMSLDAFFSQVDVHDRAISLDIKLHPDGTPDAVYYETYINAIVRLLDRHSFNDRFYVESQSPQFLSMLKARRSDLKLFYYPSTFEEGLSTAQTLGVFGISIDMNKINADQMAAAHAQGFWVALWNAESNGDNEDAIRLDPEIIQTDRLDHMIGLLD